MQSNNSLKASILARFSTFTRARVYMRGLDLENGFYKADDLAAAEVLIGEVLDVLEIKQFSLAASLPQVTLEVGHRLGFSSGVIALVSEFVANNSLNQANLLLISYILALQADGCSESTIKNYRSDIGQFFAFSNETAINKIFAKPKVQAFLREQKAKGLAKASIRRKLVSITQLAIWMELERLVPPHHFTWLMQLSTEFEKIPQSAYDSNLVENPNNQHINSNKSAVQKDSTFNWRTYVSNTAHNQSKSLDKSNAETQKGLSALKRQERRFEVKSGLYNLRSRLHAQSQRYILPYLNLMLSLILFLGMGYFGYQQIFSQVEQPLAYPTALTRPNRTLSFQGRLTDTNQNPITTASDLRFRLYDSGPSTSGGTLLWDSNTCSVTPDQDGIFAAGLGADCGAEIDSSVFSENANVWLQVEVEGETLSPRQSIKSVAYALNAETLQGFPPADTTTGATNNTVLVMNDNGEVLLGQADPVIKSTSGTFAIEAQTLTLQTGAGSNGNITLDPDGTGKIKLLANVDATGYIKAPGATLSATYAGGTALTLNAGPSATADIMRWQNSAGSTLGVINSAGSLGIGTTTTSSKLDVFSSSTNSDVQRWLASDGSRLGRFTETSGGAGWFEVDNSSGTAVILFRADSSTSYINAGNFGIGTTAPAPGSLVDIAGYAAAAGATLSAKTSGEVALTVKGGPSGTADLARFSDSTGSILSIINSAGNLGLGTTTASQKLDVAGAIRLGTAGAGNVLNTAAGSAPTGNLYWGDRTVCDNSGSCGSGFSNYWRLNLGTISPANDTLDLLVGSNATASAKFAVLNVNNGTPTASVSSGVSGNSMYLTATGILATEKKQTLTIGNSTTGNVVIHPSGTGNVGIGTTLPVANLDVRGDIAAISGSNPAVLVGDAVTAGNYGYLFWETTSDTTIIGTEAGGPTLAVAETGNVGIGTTNPTRSLDLSGDLRVRGNDISDSADTIRIALGGTTTLTNSTTVLSGTSTLTASSLATFTTAATLGMGSTTTLNLGSNATINGGTAANTDLTLQGTSNATRTTSYVLLQPTAGNVGIGTTAPSSFVLEVAGDIGPNANDTYSLGSDSLRWADLFLGGNTLHIGTSTTDEGTFSYDTSTNILGISTDSTSNGDIAFFTDDLYLDKSAGSIGIGTTAPSQALDVTGAIRLGGAGANNVLNTSAAGGSPSGALYWGDRTICDSSGTCAGFANYWRVADGMLSPINDTYDFAIGGIATDSAKFAVLNVNSGTPAASVSSGVSGTAAYLTADGTLATTRRHSLYIGNTSTYDTTGQVFINSNGTGNVGIGTTTTSSRFEVVGNSNNANIAKFIGDRAGSNVNLYFQHSSAADVNNSARLTFQLNTDAQQRTAFEFISSFSDIADATRTSTTYFAGSDNGSYGNRMALVGSNFGIATIAPTARLDIAGNASTSATLSFRGGTDPKINILNGEHFGVQTSPGGDAGLDEKFTIRSNGNVGIGSTNPGQTLDLVGNARISGLTASQLVGTDASKNLVSITTSAFISNSLSDETGSGALVFSTSPTLSNSLITDTASFDLLNTTATTINFAGAASTLNIGPSSNAATSINFAGGSGDTGCTVDGATGDLNCSGSINGIGTVGYWQFVNGAISPATPYTNNADLLIGGNATESAKFAVLNVFPGTAGSPTASVSSGVSGTATYLTADGTLATQNRATLNIGNSSTYDTTGDVRINPNGTGNVGIGSTSNVITADGASIAGLRVVSANSFVASFEGSNTFAGFEVNGTGGSSVPFIQLNRGTNRILSITAQTDNDTINFRGGSASGTAILTMLKASGNVGIGTSTPNTRLDIAGYAAAAGATLSAKTAGEVALTVKGGPSGTADLARFSDSTGSILSIINSAGNLGIGTTSAGQKLDVAGAIRLGAASANNVLNTSSGSAPTGNLFWGNRTICDNSGSCGNGFVNYWRLSAGAFSTVNDTADLLIGSNATASAKFAVLNVNSGTPVASISSGVSGTSMFMTADGTLGTQNRQTLTIGNSSTYNTTGDVFINPNGTGNVGIGTTVSSAKLEISKDTPTLGSATELDYALRITESTADVGLLVGVSSADDASFIQSLDVGTSWTTRPLALMPKGGNVGVGTITPGAKLDVTGRIMQSGAAGITNYLHTNSTGLSSTTNLNPGILVFGPPTGTASNYYGMDLGYANSRYRTRMFGPTAADISFGFHTASTAPTGQSSFTEAMVIRGDSGNVGIGTAAPAHILSIYSPTTWSTLGIIPSSAARSADLIFLPFGAISASNPEFHTGQRFSDQAKYSIWRYDGSHQNTDFAIDNSGNVGIGTSTPNQKLQVFGTVDGDVSTAITNNYYNSASSDDTASLRFQFLYQNAAALSDAAVISAEKTSTYQFSGNNDADLTFSTELDASLTEKMRIKSNGNVGIGSTGPLHKIDVVQAAAGEGAALRLVNTTTTGYTALRFSDSSAAGSDAYIHYFNSGWTQSNYWIPSTMGIGSAGDGIVLAATDSTNGQIQMFTGTASTSPDFILNPSGSVGIGSVSPGQKLDVTGNIRSSSQLISTVATGTAPLAVSSTTAVSNLNADMVDGHHTDTAYNSFGNGTVPVRHSSGYLFSNYFNMTANDVTSGVTKIPVETGNDGYLRWGSAAAVIGFTNTADGAGSGMDADLLDGISSGSFVRNDVDNSIASSGVEVTFPSGTTIANATADLASLEVYGGGGASTDAFMQFHVGSDYAVYFGLDGTLNDLVVGGWSMGATQYRIWHAGNDGSGSGLDADLIDGLNSAQFLRSDTNDSTTGTLTAAGMYSSNWFRATGDSGLYFETYGTGIRSPISEGGEYGSVATYNNEGGWDGYSLDGKYVFMSNSTDVGIYNDINNRWWMYLDNGTATQFFEPDSSTEAMRIAANGNVAIGTTTTTQARLAVNNSLAVTIGGYNTANGNGVIGTSSGSGIGVYGISGTGHGVQGESSGTTADAGVFGTNTNSGGYGVWGYTTSGYGVLGDAGGAGTAVRARNTSTGYALYCDATTANKCGGNQAWFNASDRRLKKDILSISNALDKVLHLEGVTYIMKNDPTNTRIMGFIAQDTLPYAPEVVSYDAENDYYGMSAGQLTALLVEAMKQQQTQIESLGSDSMTFTSEGELTINGDNGNYTVTKSNGTQLTTIIGASKAVIGKITAGMVTTKELVVQKSATIGDLTVTNVTIAGQSLQDYINNLIQQQLQTTSLPPGSVASDFTADNLTINQDATISGQLDAVRVEAATISAETVQAATISAHTIAASDLTTARLSATTSALGNLLAQTATISGDLTVAQDATVTGTLTAGSIDGTSSRFQTLEARMAELESIKAQSADLVNATISGTLYANDIANFDEKVAGSLQKPTLLQLLTGNTPPEPEAASPASIYEPVETAGYQSVNPDLQATDSAILSLDETDVVLGASAVFVEKYLEVNGPAYVAQTLGIGSTLKVGNSLVITNGTIDYHPAGIETPVLALQSSGQGKLDFLAGAMTIESGQVAITGDLTIAGKTKTDTLLTNLVQPADFGNPFQVQVAGVSTQSGEVKKSRFEIINETGQAVASFDADGNASFSGTLSVANQNLTSVDAANDTVSTDKSSGQAKLKANKTSLTIETPKATSTSLIYVTPKGSTDNKVLYIKSQENGKFTVGLDQAVGNDIPFNWWIVN